MSSKEDDQEQRNKSTIRIVDRRRFDSSGDEKSEDLSSIAVSQNTSSTAKDKVADTQCSSITGSSIKAAEHASTESSVQRAKEAEQVKAQYKAASADFIMNESNNNQGNGQDLSEQESEISFGSFVLSLATQALMQLGQLKAPDGMSIPVDPASAKQTIDILGVLQEKTKGNLDVREEGLLRDALHSLRLAFLRFR